MSEERDYLAEAHAIILGSTMLLAEKRHLCALAADRVRIAQNALEIIKTWHCMGMKEPAATQAWEIYLHNAPEMRELRTAAGIP